ncbi:restriction endonuclease [Paenibacillus sp. WQ 127069]|uniref:Restriction endonuclease n=1 Tax=Paenibacillus baimaensis TaxID=2982185 RepID=A0ABT2UMY2_9BACL|nr:restriction endonuclease [Paenibacillus sp. WQ 127069]MCU6795009.1 restriction endonuclease [Paenibacillus sp. WQ 127069]
MHNYDFLNLSAIEFEDLARDLLQKQLNIYLESFTEGKDGGIDLRGSTDKKKSLLVQCKRYKDFKSLKSNLTIEVPKVKKLNPQRYVIVTSVGLTPNNKAELVKMFAPYILSTTDIFGKNDLNNLLGQNNDIEEKYYKLWLSSTTVLKAILQANVKNRSEFLADTITNSIKLFVQNKSVNEAIDILNDNNFIIISGNPGVGKTTLAKMLIFQYMSKGYELVEITKDIEEGNKLFSPDQNQVFYYDDFLGSNFLEDSIAKNEDKRLYSFMERVKIHNNKKLIMTTREYILKQAQQKYEVLGRQDVDLVKHILDLESYTKIAKAEIFYNHLFFSELPEEYITSIVSNKGYYKIINHLNYSPRVIELMTFRLNKQLIPPDKYLDHFLISLTNPSEIWKSAFENQISELSKYILYALLLSNSPISEEGLILSVKGMIAYDSLKFNLLLKRGDFLNSLKELENTFIKITRGVNGENFIQFQNPSVKDFLIYYIEFDNDLIEMIINSMIFFNQLFTIFDPYDRREWSLYSFGSSASSRKIKLNARLRKCIENKIIIDFDKMIIVGYAPENSYNEKLIYINRYYNYSNKDINCFLADKMKNVDITLFEADERETFVSMLKKLQHVLNFNITNFIVSYTNCMSSLSDVRGLIELASIYPEEYATFYDKYGKGMTDLIAVAIDDDVSNVDDTEDDINGLIGEIEDVSNFFEVEMKSVFTYLMEKLEDLENDMSDYADHRLITKSEEALDQKIEDLKIDNMFNSLLK